MRPVTRVIIVDDHVIIRDSLARIIASDAQFEVVATLGNGDDAYQFVKANSIDLVLMDIVMPVMDGIASTALIKAYDDKIKVVLLTTFIDKQLILNAYHAKVDGYILKDVAAHALLENLRASLDNRFILPNNVAQQLLGSLHSSERVTFTVTEKQIIDLLVAGYCNKDIATRLNISYGTVRNYISNIYHSLGVSSRDQAIEKLKQRDD